MWALNVNNLPSPLLVSLTSGDNAYGFFSNAVFRASVLYPRLVALCPQAVCDYPDSGLVDLDSTITAAYTNVKHLGFDLGGLGKYSNIPTIVDVEYKWTGVYPSMTLGAIMYMDGNGQVLDGNINVKVRPPHATPLCERAPKHSHV